MSADLAIWVLDVVVAGGATALGTMGVNSLRRSNRRTQGQGARPPEGAIDVTARGVPSDGLTDAAGPLQALFDAVPPGSVLWFPVGVYAMATVPRVNKPLILRGTQGAARFVSMAGQSTALLSIQTSHVAVEGLSFECDTVVGIGVDAYARYLITDVSLRNIDVYQSTKYGVRFGSTVEGSGDFSLLNSRLTACARPVEVLDYANGVVIVDNQILSSPTRGISVGAVLPAPVGASNLLIDRNTVESLKGTDVVVVDAASDVRIARNLFIAWNGLNGMSVTVRDGAPTISHNSLVQKAPMSGTIGQFFAGVGTGLTDNIAQGFEYGFGLGTGSSDAVILRNTATPSTTLGVFEVDPATGDRLPLVLDEVARCDDNVGLALYLPQETEPDDSEAAAS